MTIKNMAIFNKQSFEIIEYRVKNRPFFENIFQLFFEPPIST